MKGWIGIAGMALAAIASPGWAADASRVTRPVVSIEKPGQCVEATAVMRRDHMKFLAHQRDRTVRDGVRTKPHSLAGCVDCHASSKTGSVLGADGFCQSCHAYVGVRLDCFECHAAKPARVAQKAAPK